MPECLIPLRVVLWYGRHEHLAVESGSPEFDLVKYRASRPAEMRGLGLETVQDRDKTASH